MKEYTIDLTIIEYFKLEFTNIIKNIRNIEPKVKREVYDHLTKIVVEENVEDLHKFQELYPELTQTIIEGF